MSKDILFLEERVEKLKSQLCHLSTGENPPSIEYYYRMKFDIQQEIETIEQMIRKEKEHKRMMKPFIITNYVAIIATLALLLYFYLRH